MPLSLKNDLASVVADPQWLPSHWDAARNALQFAFIPRELHRKLTFLADEYLKDPNLPVVWQPVSSVRATNLSPTTPHYIFHSAFCCSTLLSRALDIPGVAMSLAEPQILNELAGAMRAGRLQPGVLDTVKSLLSRPFGPGEALVVKPSNEANGVANALLASDSRSRAIFLYAPLPKFLASVANKGMWGRIWGRRLYTVLSGDGRVQFGLSDADAVQLTDLQVTALAWLLHHAEALALLKAFPGRVRTLDSRSFLANRAGTLMALSRHFGLDLDQARSEAIVAGEVFQTHSKQVDRSFDGDPALGKEFDPTIEEEIAMVGTWIQAMADHVGLAIELPKDSALIPQPPAAR
jgi:hypothetical protein